MHHSMAQGMVVLLPFYVSFRYPAKLTVLVAFAIAMLAAIGLERLKRLHSVAEVEPTDPRSPVGRTSWIALFIIAVSALMLAFSLVFPADALDRFVRLSLLIESIDINKAVYPAPMISDLNKLGYKIDVDTARARQDHDFLFLCPRLFRELFILDQHFIFRLISGIVIRGAGFKFSGAGVDQFEGRLNSHLLPQFPDFLFLQSHDLADLGITEAVFFGPAH